MLDTSCKLVNAHAKHGGEFDIVFQVFREGLMDQTTQCMLSLTNKSVRMILSLADL